MVVFYQRLSVGRKAARRIEQVGCSGDTAERFPSNVPIGILNCSRT